MPSDDRSRRASPPPPAHKYSYEVNTKRKKSSPYVRCSLESTVRSERVMTLLMELDALDSIYLVPTTEPFPKKVKDKLRHHPVRKYELKDYYGYTVFYAAEITGNCCYYCCSNNRAFQIFMYNPDGDVVFEVIRACGFALCCCGIDCCCCIGGIETDANFRLEEDYIGSVVPGGDCCSPQYVVRNAEFDEMLCITGPSWGLLCPCRLCWIESFRICVPQTHVSLGKIMYGYDGLYEEVMPDPGTVAVIFPPKCTPEIKALLLAAGFMLDVTYFQRRGCTFHRTFRQSLYYIFIAGVAAFMLFIMYMFGFFGE